MIKEQPQPDSTVGIFAPVKKLQLNCFKKHLKAPVKLKNRIVQLGDDANIGRKMAIISKSREIDTNKIISNHELTIAPRTVDTKGNKTSVCSKKTCWYNLFDLLI